MSSDSFQRRFFVLAPSFHGATLLARLLSLHPEVVSLGDAYPDNRYDQVCGCGALVSQCPFWTRVKEGVRAERYADHPKLLPYYPAITGGSRDLFLYHTLPLKVLSRLVAKERRQRFCSDYDGFLRVVHGLQPGSPRVFVDGLKRMDRFRAFLAFGYPMDGVIHLTRDPVDFVGSYQKNKGPSLRSLVQSALWWRRYHCKAAAAARRLPYLRLGYEELAENPDQSLADLFRFLGVTELKLEDLLAHNGEVWHFMGNSSLFGFDGTIRRSRHELSGPKRMLIGLLTGRGALPARSSG